MPDTPRASTLCQAKLTEENGSRWLCIRMKDHGPLAQGNSARDHIWAPDTGKDVVADAASEMAVLLEAVSRAQAFPSSIEMGYGGAPDSAEEWMAEVRAVVSRIRGKTDV